MQTTSLAKLLQIIEDFDRVKQGAQKNRNAAPLRSTTLPCYCTSARTRASNAG